MVLRLGLTILFLSSSLSGCVSVSLGKDKVQRSTDYRVGEPPPPYVSHSSHQVDRAWKNPIAGTIISIVSECSQTYDPPLPLLRDEVVSTLGEVQIETESQIIYQDRGALRSFVTGKVDGVASAADLLVVKKNGCSYILGLVGPPAQVKADQTKFDKFLSGFEVP